MKGTCVEGTVPKLFEGKMISFIKCKVSRSTSVRAACSYIPMQIMSLLLKMNFLMFILSSMSNTSHLEVKRFTISSLILKERKICMNLSATMLRLKF